MRFSYHRPGILDQLLVSHRHRFWILQNFQLYKRFANCSRKLMGCIFAVLREEIAFSTMSDTTGTFPNGVEQN